MNIYIKNETAIIFKQKLLEWAENNFDVFAYYDNNFYDNYKDSSYELIAGIGVCAELTADANAWAQWRSFVQSQPDEWLFAGLSYDLKNELEQLQSLNPDGLDFPLLHCFVPEHLFLLDKQGNLSITSKTTATENLFNTIQNQPISDKQGILKPLPPLQKRITTADYLQKVSDIRAHIAAGDLYEMNFCQEFFIENAEIEPMPLFRRLNAIGKAPFSAYYKNKKRHLICASPERFIKKQGDKILSQPIKGTTKRGANAQEDALLQAALRQSIKDQAENVMIVDLVRNDLSRSCQVGTVKVEELFGVYPFAQVWQMISSVSGTLRPEVDWMTALQRAFPMGSMTGAPKVMSMQLIEQYEASRRGWYSGAVGYITPQRDFDWNVVIRSLFYNADNRYLSFHVGGAIVYDSTPEQEYEECLLKAQGILRLLAVGF